MRVLVIGGTRFIGAATARQLAEAGHDVTVYHRGGQEVSAPARIRHVHSRAAGIPVLRFADELFAPEPDAVIHMIAMGEPDAGAVVEAFRGRTNRLVLISSGDVYRAYGRLTRIEPGPIEPMPLSESAPLRSVLFPYRAKAASPEAMEYWYEKILAEGRGLESEIPSTVLRLPKVYGAGYEDDFAAIYRARLHPQWRWTHGYVENVAAAIVLAATHPAAAGRIYNVGEEVTPTVAERLALLPPSQIAPDTSEGFDFTQDLVYDTSRIRSELGYREIVSYEEGMRRSFRAKE